MTNPREATQLNGDCCTPDGKAPVSDRRFRPILTDNALRRFLFPPRKFLEGHVKREMVIADLGSGSGYLSLPVAETVGESGKVYSVDFDDRQIIALKRKAAGRGLSNLDAHTSSAADLNFIETGTVDVVIAKGLLCCMLDHKGALAEIHRIMKPDAAAYFSVSKLGRKSDRRMVGKEEWESILKEFRVESRGEGLTKRWAWTRTLASS